MVNWLPPYMIEITRLNGEKFILNALYIEQVQAFPDTTITLYNNKKMVVKEPVEQIRNLTLEFYKSIGLAGSIKVAGERDE